MSSKLIADKDVIFQAPVDDGKIYIREETGKYQRIRRYLNVILVLLFILLPFIQYHGQQAILFDVGEQTLTLFSIKLFPQDLIIFGLLFMLSAFALFFVSVRYGRVWCGFTCPQTVWSLLFNWVERRIEGTHNQSRALDKAPWRPEKIIKKSAKHALWLAISLITALTFMSYFVPLRQLYSDFFTLSSSALVMGWVMTLAVCTYLNAGWMREKMCQHMCPYSRFQSAMFDASTKVVTYDATRGENRGPRKRGQAVANLGDCVDCKLCVQVCPAGIDIRDGLQYECINCGLCVDACNKVMDKFGYAKELIGFRGEKAASSRGIGQWLYGVASVVMLAGIVLWATTWQSFEVGVIRDRQSLYRINNDGMVENTYTLTLLNKSSYTKTFDLTVAGLEGATLSEAGTFTVEPGEKRNFVLTLTVDDEPEAKVSNFDFIFEVKQSKEVVTHESMFYSG
ncbi:cytochrome c oxidase accessory protein CcoG [Aliidiomarina soli]|uniref:Cytochrome c oxidase accessory protein CcoG n=1 Tax=Aliidiomarina soli TaxID=1928574 RepID=A0A432WHD3_9GAMM|nr:cytochrome c oxidase accessory protein CcoG [Aliidiomarina soli]RUO33184.1 cytochrome c oxidase accessory protein CcoG [Aliidiomarina soli]